MKQLYSLYSRGFINHSEFAQHVYKSVYNANFPDVFTLFSLDESYTIKTILFDLLTFKSNQTVLNFDQDAMEVMMIKLVGDALDRYDPVCMYCLRKPIELTENDVKTKNEAEAGDMTLDDLDITTLLDDNLMKNYPDFIKDFDTISGNEDSEDSQSADEKKKIKIVLFFLIILNIILYSI